MYSYEILPCGDSAVTVCFGNEVSEQIGFRVRTLNSALQPFLNKGITDLIPAFCSLTVCYNPLKISYSKLRRIIDRAVKCKQENETTKKTVHHVPVCYGGSYGPDLVDVAKLTNLSEREVISLHSGTDYLIYMIGFLPGFPYLGGMDNKLVVPRLETPRTLIPSGSVGIGGNQTGVYPMESPGGWRLIGKTPEILYSPDRTPPVYYAAGEYVRFYPVTESEYQAIANDIVNNIYKHQVTEGER